MATKKKKPAPKSDNDIVKMGINYYHKMSEIYGEESRKAEDAAKYVKELEDIYG